MARQHPSALSVTRLEDRLTPASPQITDSPFVGNIDAIGPTQRIHGGDIGGSIAAPPLLVKTFNFASRSSGI